MFQSRVRLTLPVVALAAIVFAVGCADPAKGKPQAVVGDAADAPAASGAGEVYVIGEGSTIEFTGSKVTGKHDGGFRSFEGEIRVVDGNPEASSVSVVIDTNSLWSDNDRLTGHLKSPDFFEVETYPEARFTTTSIVKNGDDYTMTGNLDLHGVEKSIQFPATIAVENGRITADAEFAIKRFDFGIVYPGKAEDLIRDDVVIRLNLVAVPGEAS